MLPIAPGTGKDVATDVVVLPDHRLRILASTDVDPSTSGSNIDVAIVGLNADGTLDTSFGPGGSGRVIFPAAAGVAPTRRRAWRSGPSGRIAVTGAANDGSQGGPLRLAARARRLARRRASATRTACASSTAPGPG